MAGTVRDVDVRLARPSDKEQVSGFLEEDDYLLDVWDSWLSEEGPLLVAEVEGRVVGVSRANPLGDGTIWLQGARVHEDYRRMGVGTALTQRSIDYGRGEGLTRARLATSENNSPARQQVESVGFREIAGYTFLRCSELRATKKRRTLVATDVSTETVLSFLDTSPIHEAYHRLYAEYFTWREFDSDSVSQLRKEGRLLTYAKDEGLRGIAIVTDVSTIWDRPLLQLGYLDGEEEFLQQVVDSVKEHAEARGFEEVFAIAPEYKSVLSGLETAGFERTRDHQMLVYELSPL